MDRGSLIRFIKADHRYVYLFCVLISAAGLSLLKGNSSPYSFLPSGSAACTVCSALFWGVMAFGAVCMAVKGFRGRKNGGRVTMPAAVRTAARWISVFSVILFAAALIDRALLGGIYLVRLCSGMETNPPEFGRSMVYMTIKGGNMLLTGIWTTVRIALLGTGIAFVLAVFMVFFRIMEPGSRDSDTVRFLKWFASGVTRLYIFIIRGTPMMVQTLIFYYFGFNLFKRTDMTVTEINQVWSFFVSGLFTVSLNSTAYLTEVLRGGIMSVDKGQVEAARSLGMSNWQAMIRVVFPQAVKNSIPAIGNEFIINIKDSSVLSVIGVMDLMYATKSVSGIYFRSLEIYCVAALIYLVLTWLSSVLLNKLGRRLDVPVKGIPSSN